MKFYYIRGINLVDTPMFVSIREQNQFFEGNIVTNIETSFYPPHYRNRVYIEDFGFNSEINYLSLDYKDKTYYYFIDSIQYISEGVIAIDITMDTIQTYMFDIEFINADVTRRTIDRWIKQDDGTYKINRNYNRENFSKNVLHNIDYKQDNPIMGAVVIKSNPFTEGEKTYGGIAVAGNDGRLYYEKCWYRIFPIPNKLPSVVSSSDDIFTLDIYDASTKEKIADFSGREIETKITEFIQKPDTLEAFYLSDISLIFGLTNIKQVNLNSFSIEMDRDLFENSGSVSSTGQDTLLFVLQSFIPKLQVILNTKELTKNFDFKVNKSTNTMLRNTKLSTLVPQLLDENYVEFRYGTLNGLSTYALSTLELPKFEYFKLYEIGSNSIAYIPSTIKTGTISQPRDYYNNKIIISGINSYPLYNDAWKQYLALNSGSIATGIIGDVAKIATSFIPGGSVVSTVSNIATNIVEKGIVDGRLRTTNKRNYTSMNQSETQRSSIGGGVAGGLGLLNTAGEMINKVNAPDTIKSIGTFSANVMFGLNDDIEITNQVIDIEKVAETYELYGYSVNEHYVNENLFQISNTRYYYNFIQCDKMSITLNGLLNDSETKENIIERFQNGLRLWNLGTGLNIGEILIYDNVERGLMTNE